MLKLLAHNFLGAAIGTGVYQFITQDLVGGLDVQATAMAMLVFGGVFATVSSLSVRYLRASSLLAYIGCGLISVVLVGLGILSIVGTEHMTNPVTDGLLPWAALFGLAALIGSGGYSAMRLFAE